MHTHTRPHTRGNPTRYPTGLGALLVRRATALPLLEAGDGRGAGGPRFFGGGTVLVALADEDYVRR
jgi:hypothetical protein